jgi:hypothetical protein
MSDLKDTIELSLDASGVETGVGRARHSLESLGNAASSAGEKAATGFNKFGEGGKAAADKIERDTRRMLLLKQLREALALTLDLPTHTTAHSGRCSLLVHFCGRVY